MRAARESTADEPRNRLAMPAALATALTALTLPTNSIVGIVQADMWVGRLR